MPTDPHRALAVFLSVLAHPDPAGRAAALDRACAADPALRGQVEALLADHPAEPATVDPAEAARGDTTRDYPLGPATTPPPNGSAAVAQPLGPGTVLAGRYTLRALLGEGGMGQVWAADQTQPVQRPVAVKLIKGTQGPSQAVLARFEQERQALALMDHPHVAKVLDGGLTDGGAPFFVMELVPGQPLTAFADGARLTVRERLELFVRVCLAVQHAHQKGLIHRDLKPGNVLVTAADGPPAPKVIDFGLAKATGGRITDQSVATQFGAVVGTLEYMAPEQTGYGALDLDTRADVYALGVILYELLTGLRPIDAERAERASLLELLRIIQEEEPPRPSARLAAAPDLAALAAARRAEPAALLGQLRGDLDWVVMKCLEKDRGRRYDSAAALARDVERHLADEPVEARPPAFGYRAGKFLRRHRTAAAAAALALLALVGGVVGTTWGMLRAEAALDAEAARAEGERQARRDAEAAAAAARAAQAVADRRLEQVNQSFRMLLGVFKDLDPKPGARDDRPLRAVLGDRLTQVARAFEGATAGDPGQMVQLTNQLAVALIHVGAPDQAVTLLEKARAAGLGPDDPLTLRTLGNLGLAHKAAGHLDRAVPLFEEAHRRMRAVRGADDPETLAVLNNLAAGLQTAGQNERALPLLEDLLARRRATLPADHPDVVASLNNLAAAYRVANRPDRALPLCEEALRRTRTAYGEEHPYTFLAMGNLAGTCKALGRLDRALPLWDEVLRHLQATVGKDHPDALVTLNNLALGYQAAGRLDRAVPLLEAARQGFQAKLGTEHPATLLSLNNLAAGYQAAGQPDRALPLFREAAAGMERRQFRHAYAGGIVGGLVGCLEALGQDDQAEAWRRKWLAAVKEQAGPEAPAYAQELAGLGAYLLRRGQGSAAAVLREALAILARADPGGWGTAHVRVLLGTALLNEGKAAEAGPLLREGHQGLAAWEGKTLGPPPARLLAAAAALARLEEAGDRPLAASPFRAEAARRWAAELHRDLAWPLLWGWPVAR